MGSIILFLQQITGCRSLLIWAHLFQFTDGFLKEVWQQTLVITQDFFGGVMQLSLMETYYRNPSLSTL